MKKQKSFTLIELLVVIAIIGLLSSIVLVSIKGVREKAKIARSLQFSANVKNVLGVNIIGEWRFEENSDSICGGTEPYNDICDTSGNKNHGSNTGVDREPNPPDKINQLGQAGNFDGDNDYIEIQESPSLNRLNGTDDITIEAWLRITDISKDIHMIVYRANNFILFLEEKNKPKPKFRIAGLANTETLESLTEFKENKWYHLLGTYDGSDMKLFINGKEDKSKPFSEKMKDSLNNPLYLGFTSYAIDGFLDEIRIYGQSLTSAQIRKLYVEGAEKKGLTIKD